jgi:hypothetical protein
MRIADAIGISIVMGKHIPERAQCCRMNFLIE